MNQRKADRKPKKLLAFLLVLAVLFSGCEQMEQFSGLNEPAVPSVSMEELPAYEGTPYVVIDENIPTFSEEEMTTESFETYSELDGLGRCGTAFANVGRDLMPTEKRGSIGMIKPSGWQLAKYDIVDGKYLYNRCHLLGYQLTGENANRQNLITGTRYMNVEGMLPFEDSIADYVKETGNHVLYRVTPIYQGHDLLASGVQMEGYSVEDQGQGICFHVFVYNVQPGIEIDYSNGDNWLSGEKPAASQDDGAQLVGEIRGNQRSKVYHCPGQRAYDDMGHSKNLIVFETEQEAIEAGYRKAKQ